jgi:transcriptional regulator
MQEHIPKPTEASNMELDEWVQEAVENTRLSERRARALWHRQHGKTLRETADVMGINQSNVSNAESEARQEIEQADSLLSLAAKIGAGPEADSG